MGIDRIPNRLNSIDEIKEYVNDLKVADIGWDGKRKFYSGNNKKASMNEIIDRVSSSYKETSLKRNLTDDELISLNEIFTKLKSINEEANEALSKKSKLILLTHWFSSFFGNLFDSSSNSINLERGYTVNPSSLLKGEKINIDEIKEKRIIFDGNKSKLDERVKEALDYSYSEYYSKPFTDTQYRPKEAKWKIGKEEIHRYNHGLAHSVRKSFYIPFVLDYFERNGQDHLTSQLQELFKEQSREEVIAKLQIVMAFEVTGRESECGSRDNIDAYKKYLVDSKENFKSYCSQKDLVGPGKLFKDKNDLERYACAIENKYPNRSLGEKMDVITALVDATHTLDEFRCYWPSRMKGKIEEINHCYAKSKNNVDLWNLAKFCQQAVKETGDRLMTEFQDKPTGGRKLKFAVSDLKSLAYRNFHLTDSRRFIDCSKDTTHCWEALQKVSQPISYSQGETTYSYLKNIQLSSSERAVNLAPKIAKTNGLQNQESPEDKIGELSEIIAGTRAAIRLVNTENGGIDFEMRMLNDPVFFRPLRKTPQNRDWVLSNRKEKKVEKRGFKARTPLSMQIQEQAIAEKKQAKIWGPVHRDEDRGKAKFTEFTKKLPLSLLRRDGKVKHFQPGFPNTHNEDGGLNPRLL